MADGFVALNGFETPQSINELNRMLQLLFEPESSTPSIPSGIINMWSGSIASIPSGWLLCDGSNGTPDLRNRFIVGADADSGGVAKSTVTGSATQSGDGSVPAHTHAAGTLAAESGGAHTHTLDVYEPSPPTAGLVRGLQGGTPWSSPATSSNGAHTHSVSGSTGSIGTGSTNIAVYYALAFIMKV